jgi:hypothetical protein
MMQIMLISSQSFICNKIREGRKRYNSAFQTFDVDEVEAELPNCLCIRPCDQELV